MNGFYKLLQGKGQSPGVWNSSRKRNSTSGWGHKLSLFAALFLLLSSTGVKAAGMSGNYTIDPSGSGSTNFTTFALATSALSTNGVSGACKFTIAAGTYTTGLSVGAVTGASATNTIRFTGAVGRYATTPVTISTGSSTAINFNGANYVMVDNVVVQTSSANYVINASGSNYCTVSTSNIFDNGSSSSTYMVYASSSKYFTLNNCYVYGGYYEIYMQGSQGSNSSGYMNINNNRFIADREFAFYDWYAYGDNFTYNVLDSTNGGYYGTYMYYTNGTVLNGNKFFGNFGYSEYAVYQNYYPVSGSPKQWQFTNNVVANFQYYGSIDEALYISNASGGENWSHNTIYGGSSSTGGFPVEFVPEYAGSQSMTFCSNIIYNVSGSYGMYMLTYASPSDVFVQNDGNDYYSAVSATWVLYTGTTYNSYSSYSAFIAGEQGYFGSNTDAHGTNIAPTFVSASSEPFDFHLAATSKIPGGVYCGINYDADGAHRFKSTAAGAYESLVGIKNDNAGVFAVLAPYTFCAGQATYIVDVANLGLNDITKVTVGWSVDGVVQTPISINYTIKEFHDTAVTLGTFTFATGVNHTLKAWTSLPNGNVDTKTSDDTIVRKNISPSLSGKFTIDPSKGNTTTNFSNFTNACTSLINNGVCGPVVFNVAQGTYPEQVKISGIGGVSSTNTITFDGGIDSSKTIVTNSANPTVNVGNNYITWKHFTVKNTGSGVAVALQGNYCTVANGRALTDSTGTGSTSACGVAFGSGPTSGANNNHSTCTHMYCSGGYYGGLCAYGSAGSSAYNTVTYNSMMNGYYAAMYFYFQDHINFSHNVIKDKGTYYGYAFMYYSSNATIDGNYWRNNYYTYLYGLDYTGVTGGTSYVTNNAFMGHTYSSGGYGYFYYWYGAKVWYNVFYELGAGGSVSAYWGGASTLDVRNNIFYRTGSSQQNFYISSPSSFGALDYNDFFDGPGVGGTGNLNGSNLSTWQTAQAGKPYACNHCVSVDPGFKSLASGSEDFHMAKGNFGVAGNGQGITVTYDFDGDKRCVLFPNMGLDEVTAGKGSPNVNFYPTSNDFPGSPSVVYSNYKPGAPVASTWYLQNSTYSTLTKVPAEGYSRGGDSVTLYTTKFTTGINCLSLAQITCGGKDSVYKCFNISAPTAVPVSEFVANKNLVLTGDIVSFHDLSTNGPQTWSWTVSPDSVIAGGAKVPSVKWIFPPTNANKAQNPQIQFLYPGKYTICLQTTNGVGKGTKNCKTNYITVLPAVNIGSVSVVTTASGYLYDDGGATGNYISNGGAPSTLIQPCADSVYLAFSQFDLNCNVAFLQLYEGTNVKGKRLDPCGGSGLNSGFTGGPTASCSGPCFPSISRPDTFRAKKAMFVQMNDGSTNSINKGFTAYWWSKPTQAGKPHASFTDNGSNDSVCVNAQVNFTNTSQSAANDPNDPLSYLWDLDGDITTWECIGTCPTALWPYFLAGPTNVTLLATNCGGTDTFVRTLQVYTPKPPKATFVADNTTPAIGQTVFFSVPIKECIDDYKWTFTKSTGSGTGTAFFLNGTNALSPNPNVSFSDLGYYDVKLFVDNNSGAAKDSVTLKQYINVRAPYCIPSVAILNQGMGISGVTLNTLTNTMTQAQQDYTNYTGNQALTTTLALGVKYKITLTRDPSLIFNAINRSVFIDWNGDGLFTGKGEEAAEDSNSTSASWTGTILVPKTAKVGATVMRLAVNMGQFPNRPCGQNDFGEYQDYTLYITPYNQAPVITLTGHQGLKDTIKLEQGTCFTEPGYKATSLLYGDLTKSVVVTSGPVKYNCLVAGTYTYSYNVSDSSGNKAITQRRIVVVTKDATPPVLVVAKPDTILLEVTSVPTSFTAPAVISALDLVDGDLSLSVTNDANKVTTNILGFYTITYTVSDLSGNIATVYRVVDVIDTLAPVIHLLGGTPVELEVGTSWVDPGVTLTDNYDQSTTLNKKLVVTSTVDSSKLGSYTVTYNLTDGSGNHAVPVVRVVNVVDTIAPTVTLNGNQFDSVEVFTKYADQGVSVSDNYKASSNVVNTAVTGTFYKAFSNGVPSKLGPYTIIYTSTDVSGNKTTVTRTVYVVDHTAPVVTLNGPSTVTVCRWFPYVDQGVTVTDNYYKAPLTIPTVTMWLNGKATASLASATTIETLFSIQYSATDGSHNTGWSDFRYVLVNPAGSLTCPASGIAPGLGLDKYINVYPNPNNGVFTISANLPTEEKVTMRVTNMLGQEIAVVHNGMLSTNNFQVDLSNEVSGVYLLNIVSGKESITKRIEIAK